MSAAVQHLTQDLRLLDLLRAHPELTAPEGVQLRERLATLCEAQGEPASPARIAETVADYMQATPTALAPSSAIDWKRPATKQEWEAARATIEAGYRAEQELRRKISRSILGAAVGGMGVGGLLGTLMMGIDGGLLGMLAVSVIGMAICSFLTDRLWVTQRELIQKKEAAIRKWAVEQTAGRSELKPRSWTHGVPGWELMKGEITPVGMRKYLKSERAMAAIQAIHRGSVPLLAIDFAHLDRLKDEEEADRQGIEDDATRKEWAALLAQTPKAPSPEEVSHD